MLRNSVALFSLVVIALVALAPNSAPAQTLYGHDAINYYTLSPANGGVLTVIGATSGVTADMARDPTTGDLYGVGVLPDVLYTISDITGGEAVEATLGSGSDASFRSITFDATGQLWGVSGGTVDVGFDSYSVYMIDKATGALTAPSAAVSLGARSSIAYVPSEDLIYVCSLTADQMISFPPSNPAAQTTINLSPAPSLGNHTGGFVYDPISDRFIAGASGTWYSISRAGAVTSVAGTSPRGLAWDTATTIPVELSGFSLD